MNDKVCLECAFFQKPNRCHVVSGFPTPCELIHTSSTECYQFKNKHGGKGRGKVLMAEMEVPHGK